MHKNYFIQKSMITMTNKLREFRRNERYISLGIHSTEIVKRYARRNSFHGNNKVIGLEFIPMKRKMIMHKNYFIQKSMITMTNKVREFRRNERYISLGIHSNEIIDILANENKE